MRRFLPIFLALLLVVSGAGSVIAATPADVAGTFYQEAVDDLMEKGIVTGYPDGSYRPAATITRAEACTIVVRSMMPAADDLAATTPAAFSDLGGYAWAAPYIYYAYGHGVISGYPDGTFRPGALVTYDEMAAMLVRALGFQAADLPGVWPANFWTKALDLGIYTGLAVYTGDPATRGNVAQMAYNVVDDIIAAHAPTTPTTPEPPTYADLAGPLAAFSGRAYGIVLDTASVLDEDGDVVEQLEFLFGNKILYVNTNGRIDEQIPSADELETAWLYGEIFRLQMSNGIVRGIVESGDRVNSSVEFDAIFAEGYQYDLTEDYGYWAPILDSGDGTVQVGSIYTLKSNDPMRTVAELSSDFQIAILTDRWLSYLDNASIYVAELDSNGDVTGYKAGTARDIKVGHFLRMYSVTGDEPGVGEIVVVWPDDTAPVGYK